MKMPDAAGCKFTNWCALICALSAGMVLAQAAGAQTAGRINAIQRLVWQQKPDGTINPVAKGATFETGDTISTGRGSSAQLLFADGGEITLRPDTQLRIEQYGYRAESPQGDDAFFRLLKGGMRAITGGRDAVGQIAASTPTLSAATEMRPPATWVRNPGI